MHILGYRNLQTFPSPSFSPFSPEVAYNSSNFPPSPSLSNPSRLPFRASLKKTLSRKKLFYNSFFSLAYSPPKHYIFQSLTLNDEFFRTLSLPQTLPHSFLLPPLQALNFSDLQTRPLKPFFLLLLPPKRCIILSFKRSLQKKKPKNKSMLQIKTSSTLPGDMNRKTHVRDVMM